MKTRTWIATALAALVLAGLAVLVFMPRPLPVETARASEQRFEVSIEEDGRTYVSERYVVSAPLAGRLERITLVEGQAVAVQQTVAVLAALPPALLDERTARGLRARVEAAEDNLQRAGSRSAQAAVQLERAASELRRSEQLAQQGFIAATQLETQRLSRRAAERELEAASAERRVAGHELEQARAALAATAPGAAGGRGFAVRSPVAGSVLRVLQSSEGVVAMGTPLLELGDLSRLEVQAELLTTDAVSVAPGQPVWLERWGGAGDLEGRVLRVEPAAFTKVSALGVEEQRVRVRVELTSPREQWAALGDGFRVGLRIVTLAQPQALVVPSSAVFPLPSAAPDPGAEAAAPRHAVFVVDGGHARQQAVVLGGRNGRWAWVKSGLAAGQEVIVYPPGTLRDGARVTVRTP